VNRYIRPLYTTIMIIILLILSLINPYAKALSQGDPINTKSITRRDVLAGASATISLVIPSSAIASPLPEAETIDLEAFNAARAKSSSSTKSSPISTPNISRDKKIQHSLIESLDPSPFLSLRGGRNGQSTIQIPRVGYSLYKTSPDLASRCVSLALRSGVRHFDVGTLYGSNAEIAKPIKLYLDNGLPGLQKGYYKDETPELLELLDATSATADKHAQQTIRGRVTTGCQ